jgi:ATP-dependent DNA ligase
LEKKFDIELRMKKIPITFVAFDILSIEGESVRKLPLFRRRELLYEAFTPIPRLGEWSMLCGKNGSGVEYFKQAEREGLEGIVGKKIDSPYLEGQRSRCWVKCKVEKTVDLWFEQFTINPAGIRVENGEGIAVQVAGEQSKRAMKEIKERAECGWR